MKKTVLFFVLFFALQLLRAQFDVYNIYNPYLGLNSAQLEPSRLGVSGKRVLFRIAPSANVFLRKTASIPLNIDFNAGKNLFTDKFSGNLIEARLDEFQLWGAASINLPSVSFAFKKKSGKPLLTLGWINNNYSGFSLTADSRILDFYLNPSKYKNSVVSSKLNAFVGTYFNSKLAASIPLEIFDKVILTLAAGYNYYLPGPYIRLKEAELLFETNSSGDIVKAKSSSSLNTAVQKNVLITGEGQSFDIGVSLDLFEKLSLTLSFLEIGGQIKYSKGVQNYNLNANLDISKLNVFDIFSLGGLSNSSEGLGFNVKEDTNPFIVKPPSRFVFSSSYNIKSMQSSKMKKGVGASYIHRIMFSYIQGFENTIISSKKPFFNFSYAYKPVRWILLGSLLNSYDSNFQWGLMTAFNFKIFSIGLSSQSALSNLLGEKSLYDFSISTQWAL